MAHVLDIGMMTMKCRKKNERLGHQGRQQCVQGSFNGNSPIFFFRKDGWSAELISYLMPGVHKSRAPSLRVD